MRPVNLYLVLADRFKSAGKEAEPELYFKPVLVELSIKYYFFRVVHQQENIWQQVLGKFEIPTRLPTPLIVSKVITEDVSPMNLIRETYSTC